MNLDICIEGSLEVSDETVALWYGVPVSERRKFEVI